MEGTGSSFEARNEISQAGAASDPTGRARQDVCARRYRVDAVLAAQADLSERISRVEEIVARTRHLASLSMERVALSRELLASKPA
jgi:hypothetical protein